MDDQTLLAKFAASRDAVAFEELTRRHAGLVKATCVRVLGNSHDAEEVAQECFLELSRHARDVHSSVAGWLHRAAMSRSLNVLRSRIRRKVRERIVGVDAEAPASVTDVTTLELHRIIDGTLKELPEDLRKPMILHYFDGRSQREVAIELGVNQSTISRRMRDALQQLRERLAQAGYVATAPAVMTLMYDKAALAASDSSSITKIAVSGATGKAVGTATTSTSFKAVLAMATPILSYLLFGGWVSLCIAICLAWYVVRNRPNWVKDVYSSLGTPDIYAQPMFCWTRWDRVVPVVGWRVRALTSLVWSVLLICLSIAFAFGTDRTPWGIVVLGMLIAIGFGVSAFRILYRVRLIESFLCENSSQFHLADSRNRTSVFWEQFAGIESNDGTMSWFDAVQLVGIGLAGVGISFQVLISPPSRMVWPSVFLAGIIGVWMTMSGVKLIRRLLRSWREDKIAAKLPSRGLDLPRDTAGISPSRIRNWTGTHSVLAVGVLIVVGLSAWIVWNPASVAGRYISLAAVQTSMLGWMVYRLAAHCRHLELSFVRRLALIVLVGCFVLNSSICLANWLR